MNPLLYQPRVFRFRSFPGSVGRRTAATVATTLTPPDTTGTAAGVTASKTAATQAPPQNHYFGGLSEPDFKKSVMATLSFPLGLFISAGLGVRLLTPLVVAASGETATAIDYLD